MQKKLLAVAVAGVFAAPAFAATSNVDIYGQLTLSYDYISTDSSISTEDENLHRISSNSSRIGFKGSEDLGGGLSAIWQIETQLDMENGTNNLSFDATPPISQSGTLQNGSMSTSLRNTFVGLKGGFGTVLLGKHDTPYKLATGKLDIFGDTAGDYNNVIGSFMGINAFDLRPGNVVAYISPTFSGVHGAIAYVAGNELGIWGNVSDDSSASAWSALVMYDQGPIFASLAYEQHDNLGGIASFDNDSWKAAFGYNFGNATVGLIYEDMDVAGAERDAWYVNGSYTMGNVVLKAAYGNVDEIDGTSNTGATTYTLGADYNLSKRTKVYALYSKTQNDSSATYGVGAGQGSSFNPGFSHGTTGAQIAETWGNAGDDPSVISIGVRHSF